MSLHRRALIANLLLSVPVAGTAAAVEPPRGSPERAEILDALRPRVEQDLGPPVIFMISRINREGAYAFVSATPQRPGGRKIDWSRTKYAREMAADAMSDVILALLRNQGGRWVLVEYELGPTDVSWVEWIPKYRLSERFFMEGAR